MTNSLSRFQLVPQVATMAPGKCCVCGGSEKEFFVDFGFQLDFYGSVYFCNDCILEVANVLDYHGPHQWKMVKDLNEELRAENNSLRDRLETLNDLAGSVSKLGLMPPIPAGSVTTVESIEALSEPEQLITEEFGRDTTESVEDFVRSDYELPESDQRIDESVTESGSTDVSDANSLDKFLDDLGI